MKRTQKPIAVLALVTFLLITISCAPGNKRFDEKPAGFWAGLWHGIIIVITFVISLFTDSVHIYEVNNSGGWYNFGFLLGAAIALGGSGRAYKKKKKKKSDKQKEWEEIGAKVEEKVREGIKNWVDESEEEGKEWEEIGRKIEEKIKRELRKWAEK
jgi:hypothetical protein